MTSPYMSRKAYLSGFERGCVRIPFSSKDKSPFSRSHRACALYQGTTLVGPQKIENTLCFSP